VGLASATALPKCVTSQLVVWMGVPGKRTFGPAVPTQTVTVGPGATVHTTLRVVVPYWDPICKPVIATSLKVYPPNNTVARNIPFQLVLQMQHPGGGRSCGWGDSLSVRGPIVPRVGIPGH
jgi:hypothetical protein